MLDSLYLGMDAIYKGQNKLYKASQNIALDNNNTNLPQNAVELIESEQLTKAGTKVIEVQNDTLQSLIDIKV